MATLEELRPGVHVKGLLPGRLVTLIEVKPYGATVAEVTYKDASGLPGTMLLYQHDVARLEIASNELPWSFDADGTPLFPERLASTINYQLSGLEDALYQEVTDTRATILHHYERVVFEKELITLPGKPQAALICPGHPLLDAVIDLLLDQHRDLLKQGAMLVDPHDDCEAMRVLFYLEHTIQDASLDATGRPRVVSRQLQFIELDEQGHAHQAGYAPFLDYRPLSEEEQALIEPLLHTPWLERGLEEQARIYAITELVPSHLDEVKQRREAQIDKTMAAVNERLTSEISYWDYRAAQLQAQEAQGKTNARLNSQQARQTAEELLARLERRMHELEQEWQISPLPHVVIGGVLVIPQGLLNRLAGQAQDEPPDIEQFARETARIERLAMEVVMQAERSLGYQPRDVSADKCGYDIESSIPGTGKLRFIEVKGRAIGAETVTMTRNEVLTALNKSDDFILAIVLVDGETTTTHYVSRPFHHEPDFGATSVNYEIEKLLSKETVIT